MNKIRILSCIIRHLCTYIFYCNNKANMRIFFFIFFLANFQRTRFAKNHVFIFQTFEHIRILYKIMGNPQSTIETLRELNSDLVHQIAELRKKFAEIEAENIEIKAENTKVKAENIEI